MNKTVRLCGDCKYFNPNGGITSDGVIYRGYLTSNRLGNCNHPIEPPYGRLKNEHNGCENWARGK